MKYAMVMKRFGATAGAAILALTPVAGLAGSYERYGEVRTAVVLPDDLCSVQQPFEMEFIEKMRARPDYKQLLDYMLTNCPELGIALADVATATIRAPSNNGGDHERGIPNRLPKGPEKPRKTKPTPPPPPPPPPEDPKEPPKDGPKEPPKDGPKEPPKEGPKEPPKEGPKEPPKEGPKEPPRGNNGFGNGDQSAPGASLPNNNAENASGKKGKRSGKGEKSMGGLRF